MKDKYARELAKRAYDKVEYIIKLERRHCPTCKRRTLTSARYRFFDPQPFFTCEICGTEYEVSNEEKITILNPKRSHKKKVKNGHQRVPNRTP
jgi:transcription elongation factor Elf1